MKADLKKRALHRTKIIQGQIKGLEKMIDQNEYCMDILTQSLAIQKSLSSLNKLIVQNHITTHINDMILSGDEKQMDNAITELLNIYELNNRRSK